MDNFTIEYTIAEQFDYTDPHAPEPEGYAVCKTVKADSMRIQTMTKMFRGSIEECSVWITGQYFEEIKVRQ